MKQSVGDAYSVQEESEYSYSKYEQDKRTGLAYKFLLTLPVTSSMWTVFRCFEENKKTVYETQW